MASYCNRCVAFAVLLLQQIHSTNANAYPGGGGNPSSFNAMYQFGDSLADTGNLVRMHPNASVCSTYPYGETFFGYPTGRCSDGLLMSDFFARALGLPFLEPYLYTSASADFKHGVNFAIVGATALDTAFLQTKNITAYADASLPIQLGWFNTHLQSINTSSHERRAMLRKSLFFMGEIGGNDINFVFIQGKSIQLAYTLVPYVAQAIKKCHPNNEYVRICSDDLAHKLMGSIITPISNMRNNPREIIDEGAVHIVVPGNFPIGCLPLYLLNNPSNDTSMYDDLNCLKAFNDLAQFQNSKIIEAVKQLQTQNPSVVIKYADYYNAYLSLLKDPVSHGFEKDQVLNQCCGSLSISCGSQGAVVCENPKTRISWDGAHPTHQANKYMARWILSRIFVS